MKEQHFERPEKFDEQYGAINPNKLIKIVDAIAPHFQGLYGFECEWVMAELRKQTFTLVKVVDFPNGNQMKSA